jgi:hypothetical protein
MVRLHTVPAWLTPFIAAAAVGFLSSGSCSLVYCSEDCDPCWQQCKCKTICSSAVPAGSGSAQALLVVHAARTTTTVTVRGLEVTYDGILGLPVQARTDLEAHARAVLSANIGLLGMPADPGASWELLAVDRSARAAVLHFQAADRVAALAYAEGALAALSLSPAE